VFSPDELNSNKFDNILKFTRLKNGNIDNSIYGLNGRVVEILNEHLCYAWSQGYSMAGHHAVIISYEAFAPIFGSLTTQHLKFLKESANIEWRADCPSVNIILTSLGWNNSPTHHNPGYVDSLIGRNLKHVGIYMPVTPESTAFFFKDMMESNNRLNIMVLNKHKLKKLSSISANIKKNNLNTWCVLTSDLEGDHKISLIAIGDCMAEESLYAKEIINSCYPTLLVQVLAIEDLSLLDSPHHPDMEFFKLMISESSCCIWAYNGYPNTIKGLLWNWGYTTNIEVLGYKDFDNTNSGFNRFYKNEVSRFHIANEAIRILLLNKNVILMENKLEHLDKNFEL